MKLGLSPEGMASTIWMLGEFGEVSRCEINFMNERLSFFAKERSFSNRIFSKVLMFSKPLLMKSMKKLLQL